MMKNATIRKRQHRTSRFHLSRILPHGLALVLLSAAFLSASPVYAVGNAQSYDGYTLFAALNDTTVYLMDNDGNFVHTWETEYTPGLATYFLENGLLLTTGNVNNTTFTSANTPQQSGGPSRKNAAGNANQPQGNRSVGGAGGIIQLIDWDGNVTWEYEISSDTQLQHHDVEMLPNGNILLVAWEYKTEAEALDAGRDPSLLQEGSLWPDNIIEIQPTGENTAEIVWEWHVWDHLVQDYDASKANYGGVDAHPELINLNYAMNANADWNHVNSVDYNAELDQILLSVHNFGEIWVIDHGTTTEEAAGSAGDLLYRWGNPQAYDAGDLHDQILYGQHDAEWIADDLPGTGNILIFNNGTGRTGNRYSSVVEITPPLNTDGSYGVSSGEEIVVWSYTADTPTDFYAQNVSGAQRLPNGNTLICNGPNGIFFEVTPGGETVWEYSKPGNYFRADRYALDYPGFDDTPLAD